MQNPVENLGVIRVFINQVDVGALPEQVYRAIVADAKQKAKSDRWLYVAQALNIVACILRMAWTIAQLMPVVLFIICMFALVAAPEVVTDIIQSIRDATPADLSRALQTTVYFFGIIGAFAFGMLLCLSNYRFGYVNKFESAISERISLRIRSILEVPADGDVAVQTPPDFRL